MADLLVDGKQAVSHGEKTKRAKLRQIPRPSSDCPIWTKPNPPVLNSLSSADAQRGYCHASDEFLEWYCSEPRLSFNLSVVLRYRIHLESRNLAPSAVNLRLNVVRRLAFEAIRSLRAVTG